MESHFACSLLAPYGAGLLYNEPCKTPPIIFLAKDGRDRGYSGRNTIGEGWRAWF